jgi:hypothetical protein
VVIAPLAGHPDTFYRRRVFRRLHRHTPRPSATGNTPSSWSARTATWKQFAPDCKQAWEGMDKDVAKREDDGETCWFDDAAGLQHALSSPPIAAAPSRSSTARHAGAGSRQPSREAARAEPAQAVTQARQRAISLRANR